MVGIFICVPNNGVVGIGQGVGLDPVSPPGVTSTLGYDPGDLVRGTEIPLNPLVFCGSFK